MKNNLLKTIKKEINNLNATKRNFEYDILNIEQPIELIEIFEKEVKEIKKELIYVKKVLNYAKTNISEFF